MNYVEQEELIGEVQEEIRLSDCFFCGCTVEGEHGLCQDCFESEII